jgi:hypothetical protein
MESSPTVEQFMCDCFRERTEALKLELEIHHAYWRRFYHSECNWDSRRGVIEKSEAEKIVSVLPSDSGTDVVTSGSVPRLRYCVKSSSEGWLIHQVDLECGLCSTKGVNAGCVMCAGKGWLSAKDRAGFMEREQRASRATSSFSEEALGARPYQNQAIEQFMTDFFREHIAAAKREVEIHSAYWKRFYSPECEWDSRMEKVKWSEAERIINVMPIDTDAYVITDGFGPGRVRYHLRPEGQSWLIWEVSMECPRCTPRRKRDNCFLCGGTGWARGKDMGADGRGRLGDEETPPQKPRWEP